MSALQPYSVGPPTGAALRLHLNEYRFPHPPEVAAALKDAVADLGVDALLTRYADDPAPLRESLAAFVGCGPDNVAVSAGSDEALRAAIDTTPAKCVVVGVPTYTHFAHFARLSGRPIHEYSLGLGATPAEQTALMETLYSEQLEAGALVYIGNPNNPTGCTWDEGSVRRLAERYPRSEFLVDEAYTEFVSVSRGGAGDRGSLNRASLAALAASLPNVVVTRTLSKAFGLAALRIGYAVGQPDTIRRVSLALSPKAVGQLAVRVGCAALACAEQYAARAADALGNALGLSQHLRAQGWWVQEPTGASFFLVYAGDASATVAALRGAGIAVRDRTSLPCLDGFLRITAGTEADARKVSAAFGALAPPTTSPLQLHYTPKGRVAEILGLFRRFLAAAAEAHAPACWLHGGTLLGWARHKGGLVPWDDDIDLAYKVGEDEADAFGVADVRDAFKARGLTVQKNRTGAYWQVGTNDPGEKISPVHIDLFPFVLKDGRWTNADPRFAKEKPEDPGAHCDIRYSPGELFPLRATRLYDFETMVPAQTEGPLARALGPDYDSVAVVRVTPGLGGPGDNVSYPLRDRTPA